MSIVEVSAEIQRLRQSTANDNEVRAERVVAESARLAFSDTGDYVTFGPDGVTLVSSDDLPLGLSRAVAEVSEIVTSTGHRTTRFKLRNKVEALDKLARTLGLFIDRSMSVSAFVRPELQGKTIAELEAIEAALFPEPMPAIDGEARVLDDDAA